MTTPRCLHQRGHHNLQQDHHGPFIYLSIYLLLSFYLTRGPPLWAPSTRTSNHPARLIGLFTFWAKRVCNCNLSTSNFLTIGLGAPFFLLKQHIQHMLLFLSLFFPSIYLSRSILLNVSIYLSIHQFKVVLARLEVKPFTEVNNTLALLILRDPV